jgi:hypothetical protein
MADQERGSEDEIRRHVRKVLTRLSAKRNKQMQDRTDPLELGKSGKVEREKDPPGIV